MENNGSGASATYQTELSKIRKGSYIVIDNRPCKLLKISRANGEAEIVGIDIFTQQLYEATLPEGSLVDIPTVTRQEYILMAISDDGFLQLMTDDGNYREDLKNPEAELGDKIREVLYKSSGTVYVTVLRALLEEAAISVRMNMDY